MADFFWTPHSGYHWDGSVRRFFEGWYLRLVLPDAEESFAFMYSIDDPAGQSPLSSGAAQILGPGEQYLYAPLPRVDQFWAWRHRLGFGHWQVASSAAARWLPAEQFWATVTRGYQVTATRHQGCLEAADTGAIARWDYTITPCYGWGSLNQPPLPTAGWLSYLPIVEPGWQVLMAHGVATGWADWQGHRYHFTDAPVYAEKNWGGAFPERWFWLQSNAFEDEPDLTVTAVGGRRQVGGRSETVGLIGIHYAGELIALSSLRDRLTWQVAPWGRWHVTASNSRYRIRLRGTTDRDPVVVRVPTQQGLQFACWDTPSGNLTVEVWSRRGTAETPLVKAHSALAGLEVGGEGWTQGWQFPHPAATA